MKGAKPNLILYVKACQGNGGSGGNIVHVKGHRRIRVKGQTGRERGKHNKGCAAAQKMTREDKTQGEGEEEERNE